MLNTFPSVSKIDLSRFPVPKTNSDMAISQKKMNGIREIINEWMNKLGDIIKKLFKISEKFKDSFISYFEKVVDINSF